MPRGVHGEKIVAAMESVKMPETDIPRLKEALDKYDEWIVNINEASGDTLEELIEKMVTLLNDYKFYIDVNLIFDSKEDFYIDKRGN